MQLDEQKPDLTEADKRLATGLNILVTIAVVRVCFSIVSLFLSGNIISLCLSVALSIALASGSNWVRWFCVVNGGIANILMLNVLSELINLGAPAYLLVLAVALMLIDIVMLAILAFNKKVNEFIEQRKRSYHDHNSNHDHHNYRGSEHHRISEEYRKMIDKKPCPLCGEDIAKTHKFCPSCGGDIAIKEEENMQIWREKLERDGYGVLLTNEKAKNDLREIMRVYGADCCISYLKEKAQELGIPSLEITADDLDGILGVG